MTNKVATYHRCLPTRGKIGHMPLVTCLKRLGVKPPQEDGSGNKVFSLHRAMTGVLYDLYDAARALYLKLVVELHPDKGGSLDLCARLNELWTRIKFLFERKGITA